MAKRFPSSPDSDDNKTSPLVADQSGLMVVLSGLALAVLLGFLVRGLTNEEMIKARVVELLKQHGPHEQIQVERSWVRLSKGAVPDFSLVLSQVHIESSDVCALSPSAEIHEIRFPLSLWGLVKGGIVFESAQIDEAVLLLRSDYKDCKGEKSREPSSFALAEPTGAEAPQSAPLTPTKSELQIPLRKIQVQNLRVNYLPVPFSTFEFQGLTAELESGKPLIFNVDSHLNINGETLSGDYSSHASWKLQYDETRQPRSKFELSGTWREGRYDLNTDFDSPSKKYNLEIDIQHIPLSQVFPVLKKYQIMTTDFNGKQSWISAKVHSSGDADTIVKSPWDITGLSLEGDLGEIKTEEIHISELEPISFQPIRFELKNMDGDKLLEFFARPHPGPTLGNLGRFNGQLFLQNTHEANLVGEHQGFEFIFSNKGSRQIQVLKSFKTKMEFKENAWFGKLYEFEIPDGELKGEVELEADRNWKDLNLQVALESLRLSPSIEKLMTQGGLLRDFSGNIRAHLNEGVLRAISGEIAGTDWVIDGLQFLSPKIRLGQNKDIINLQFKANEMKIPPKTAGSDLLTTFQQDNAELWGEQLDLKNVFVNIETRALSDFRWTEFRATADKFKLQSHGGWDQENQLFGEIKLIDKRKSHKWKLQGSRDAPQFLKN
jgi:hypothetical protein